MERDNPPSARHASEVRTLALTQLQLSMNGYTTMTRASRIVT